MKPLKPFLFVLTLTALTAGASELYLETLLPVGDDKIVTLDNGFPIQSPTYRRAGYRNDGTYEARSFDRRHRVIYTTRHMDNDRESFSIARALVLIDDPELRQSFIDQKLDVAAKAGHRFERTSGTTWETVDFCIAETETGVEITFKNAQNAERDTAIVRHSLYPVIGPLKLNETKADRVIERLKSRDCDYKIEDNTVQTTGRCLGLPEELTSRLNLADGRLTGAVIEMNAKAYRQMKAKLDDLYSYSEPIAPAGAITEGIRYFTYEPPQTMREADKYTALEVHLTRDNEKAVLTYTHPIGHRHSLELQKKSLEEKIFAYQKSRQ